MKMKKTRKPINVGDRFSLLTVLEIIPAKPRPARQERSCLCVCECGRKSTPTVTGLRSGNSKSCGYCFRLKYARPDSAIVRAFRTFKKNAETRSLPFLLSFAQFKTRITSSCFYCGALPKINCYSAESKIKVPMNSVDRRNNKLGYTVENAVAACISCQQSKWDFSEEEFLSWASRLVEYQLRKSSKCAIIKNEEILQTKEDTCLN